MLRHLDFPIVRVLAVVIAASSSVACATTNSATLATNQIKPSFAVEVNGNPNGSRTFISAILGQPATMSNVELAPGDVLTAKTDKDADVRLEYSSALQIWSATLQNVTDRGAVTFSLARANGTAAPSSNVQLPAAVALTSPQHGQHVSVASGTIPFAWSNPHSGANVRFFAYPCGAVATTSKQNGGPDAGSFAFPARDVVGFAGPPPAAGKCVTVQVVREVSGALDPAWAPGSTFKATRTDFVDVVLVP
ncbi:MAG TPA: hypothetical protein VIF62_15660 [Labilithrix sp.]|jgi:hypothetical protein